jgi:hypothetical protein
METRPVFERLELDGTIDVALRRPAGFDDRRLILYHDEKWLGPEEPQGHAAIP